MSIRSIKRRTLSRSGDWVRARACGDQYTLSLLDEATAKALAAQRVKWCGAFRRFVRDMAQPVDRLAAK